jgi:hypothetical protein
VCSRRLVFFSLILTFIELILIQKCVLSLSSVGVQLIEKKANRVEFEVGGYGREVVGGISLMLTACTVFDHCSRWRCVTASANPDFDLCVARAASKVVSIGCGCDEVLVLKSEACRYIWDCSWNERRPGSRRRDEI